jgi:hypothetical protein
MGWPVEREEGKLGVRPCNESGPAVRLREMTPHEFCTWRERSVAGLAEQLVAATRIATEVAKVMAEKAFPASLTEHSSTGRQWLLRALIARHTPVGVVWLGPHPTRSNTAYLYEVAIDDPTRDQIDVLPLMTAAEEWAMRVGYAYIATNVPGFQASTRKWYETVGYRPVTVTMLKVLRTKAMRVAPGLAPPA